MLLLWNCSGINPSTAEVTFVQCTKKGKIMKIILNLSSIHWKALAEYSQMSTHLPGFLSFSGFLHHFVLTKLATSSISVKSNSSLQWKFPLRMCGLRGWVSGILNMRAPLPTTMGYIRICLIALSFCQRCRWQWSMTLMTSLSHLFTWETMWSQQR